MVTTLPQLPLLNLIQDSPPLCWESAEVSSPPRDARNVTGCHRGTLDELVGSHTKLAIYPILAICCQRVVIHSLLDTGFKGMQVVTYLANIKQLKSHWLNVPPKRSGYMHMDKWNTQSILVMLCSTRGTEIAGVEGLWPVSRPKCSVSENADDSAMVWVCSPFIVHSQNSMRDPCDVMSWHHDHLLWSSRRKTTVHVHQKHCSSSVHLLASTPESPVTINASEPLHLFLNLNSMPVTYISLDVPIYLHKSEWKSFQSLQTYITPLCTLY